MLRVLAVSLAMYYLGLVGSSAVAILGVASCRHARPRRLLAEWWPMLARMPGDMRYGAYTVLAARAPTRPHWAARVCRALIPCLTLPASAFWRLAAWALVSGMYLAVWAYEALEVAARLGAFVVGWPLVTARWLVRCAIPYFCWRLPMMALTWRYMGRQLAGGLGGQMSATVCLEFLAGRPIHWHRFGPDWQAPEPITRAPSRPGDGHFCEFGVSANGRLAECVYCGNVRRTERLGVRPRAAFYCLGCKRYTQTAARCGHGLTWAADAPGRCRRILCFDCMIGDEEIGHWCWDHATDWAEATMEAERETQAASDATTGATLVAISPVWQSDTGRN